MSSGTVTAAAAGTWKLGDKSINRMGFGAMRLPQDGRALIADAIPADRDRAIRVLRLAVELGVNHIDTAAFYFSPLLAANELINSALAPYPDDLVIATKVGPGRDASGQWMDRARPEQLRGRVEENLRQLGRDHLDLVYYRIQPAADSLAEHVGALAELCQAGLIRHLGVSGVTPAQLAEAQAVAPVVAVQNRFAAGSGDTEMLDICGARGLAFIPFFAIAGRGGGGGATGPESAEVLAVARAHEATPAQVRLAYTLQLGPHVLAIPGTGSPGHLTENVAAGALRLSEAEMITMAGAQQPG